jgi:hypothetical protein
MKYVIAVAACAAIMVAYCLISCRSSGQPLEELIRMALLVLATDKTWHYIVNAKTLDGPSQRSK